MLFKMSLIYVYNLYYRSSSLIFSIKKIFSPDAPFDTSQKPELTSQRSLTTPPPPG